jgi:hypothetical protein
MIGWVSGRELRRRNLTTLVGLGHSWPIGYGSASVFRSKEIKIDGNVTVACKFCFKTPKIVEGELNLSLIFASGPSLVLPQIF